MLSLLNSASSSVISSYMGTPVGLGLMGGLSVGGANDNGLMSTWDNTFLPELNSLMADANSYASPARIQQAMGAAESNVAQSFDQSRNNALHDLTSFGIDPSSGRYAQLDAASRMQEAAAQAGAGNIAEQQTEAIGRSLRSEAIQATAQLPSQAASMIGANAQAMQVQVNAALGQLNASIAQENAQTQRMNEQQQMALKKLGLSSGTTNGQMTKPDPNAGQDDKNAQAQLDAMIAADAKQGGQGGDSNYNPMSSTSGQPAPASAAPGVTKADPNAATVNPNAAGGGGTSNPLLTMSDGTQMSPSSYQNMLQQNDIDQDNQQEQEDNAAPSLPGLDPTTGVNTPDDGSQTGALPTDSTQVADNSDVTANDATQDQGYTGLDPAQPGPDDQPDNSNMTQDMVAPGNAIPSDATSTDMTPPADDDTGMSAPPVDTSSDTSGAIDTSGETSTDDGGGADFSGTGDTSGSDGSYYGDGGDDSGGGSSADSSSDDDSFAAGGVIGSEQAVHARQGAIPASMSPSGGAATDDVPARLNGTGEQIRLNQGEFIMPKDVVGWNGESHYQKHIEKSRQQMAQAKARPTMKPAIPMHGGM